jgi:uncharacterized protein YciI
MQVNLMVSFWILSKNINYLGEVMKKFVYFYIMKNQPEIIKNLVPVHIKYWEDCNLKDYQGAPFSDRSGGLIIFCAENIGDAENIAYDDPFVKESVIDKKWVKEWLVR